MNTDETPTLEVVIAGGGIAALETVLALRDLAGDRTRITLVAPEEDFTYRPHLIEEPFSPRPAERLELAAIAADLGVNLVRGRMAGIDVRGHQLLVADGGAVPYDVTVICTGATPRMTLDSAGPIYGPQTVSTVDSLLRQAAGAPSRRLAVIVPPGCTWPLPAYEAAMLSQRRARDLDLDVEVRVVTPEDSPLTIFGPVPSEEVAALLDARGITVDTSVHAADDETGEIVCHPGAERLEAGAVLALPVLDGPDVVGLPSDDGFLPIDQNSRVIGVEDVYAAGDGTTFPVKQGGLATQQADAAAEHIAARVGAITEPAPFHPVLRGKLIVGDETMSMKHDLTGGHGEGRVAADYLWWPPHKVSGRYLAPWLAGETAHADPEPPVRSTDVEVSLSREWHETPLAPQS